MRRWLGAWETRAPAPILVDPESQWSKVGACAREREFARNDDDAAEAVGGLARLERLVGLLGVAAGIPGPPYSYGSGWWDGTEDHQCCARRGDIKDP